jgi:hypothetical protein
MSNAKGHFRSHQCSRTFDSPGRLTPCAATVCYGAVLRVPRPYVTELYSVCRDRMLRSCTPCTSRTYSTDESSGLFLHRVFIVDNCNLVQYIAFDLFFNNGHFLSSLCEFRHVYARWTITLSSFTIFKRCRGRPFFQRPISLEDSVPGIRQKTSGSLLSVARGLTRSRGRNHTDWGCGPGTLISCCRERFSINIIIISIIIILNRASVARFYSFCYM